MSCCYCITRARSITACVDCSLQAKTVLSNSIFLHYTFFSCPKLHFTQMFLTHQYCTCAGSCCSSGSLPSPEDTTIPIWGALTARGCCVPTTKPTSPQALLCSVPAPNFAPRAQGKGVGAAGTPSPFQRDRSMEFPSRLEGLTWCHLPAQPGPSQSAGLQPASSGISPVSCVQHQLHRVQHLSFGVTVKGKEGSLREA